MCGIAGIFGSGWRPEQLSAMQRAQTHRGPDAEGIYIDPTGMCGLSHNRLSIIDLSDAGRQPFTSFDNRYRIVLNGEIYNYVELKRELRAEFDFRTQTDTEVLLAAYIKWGANCLSKLIGMFAFVIWDERSRTAFGARDRFGVKPLYFHLGKDSSLFFASEIKAIHAAGVVPEPDTLAWANYLVHGTADRGRETFWREVESLPAGHSFTWRSGRFDLAKWYDLADNVGSEFDDRPDSEVEEEYFSLLKENVRLRFRADVPVAINLSGGLDSSILLGLVHSIEKPEQGVTAYTFATGDDRYDELPWVQSMLAKTHHPHMVARLSPHEVPDLASDVQFVADEPYGGLPTIAYAKLFETARANGTVVLLDGNGMDEQWAGYDYYLPQNRDRSSLVQGSRDPFTRPNTLAREFRELASPPTYRGAFPDSLRNLQYRDLYFTKIPRAMRFNDRISMRSSTELREPFLDHRLFELSFRQPVERKIANGQGKALVRRIAQKFLPQNIATAPKRPMQTPQREWLRGPLRDWATDRIDDAFSGFGGDWLDRSLVTLEWKGFCEGNSDNSFYVWQWITLGLMGNLTKSGRRVNSPELSLV